MLCEMEEEIHLPGAYFSQPCSFSKCAKNALLAAAGRSGAQPARWCTFTHLGAVQHHRCHRALLTDHLQQPLRSVCLREQRLSERRERRKIGPMQGEIKLSCSVCLHRHRHTHSACLAWLLLTAPPSPLPSPLPLWRPAPSLSLLSSRYMCRE